MGVTHFRSDVKESGARTASFSTITAGTISSADGIDVATGKYYKLGSIYIITGVPAAFTKAGIDAVATLAAGVAANTSIPRGSMFLNASSGATASQGMYVKAAPSTWAVVTTGSEV